MLDRNTDDFSQKDTEDLLRQLNERAGANSRQVGGTHYKKDGTPLQHWDVVVAMKWDYFQGNITKYVDRHARKKGFEDLMKAMHYLEKYMEVTYPEQWAEYQATKGYSVTVSLETDDMDSPGNDLIFGSGFDPDMSRPHPIENSLPHEHLVCRNCGDAGHINIDCPEPLQPVEQPAQVATPEG